MQQDECANRVRFVLSDERGALAFREFRITRGLPDCKRLEDRLRDYLVGRPLAQVDPAYVRSLTCKGTGECSRVVARTIEEHQDLFAGGPSREQAAEARVDNDTHDET